MFTSLKIEKIGNPHLGFQPAWVRIVKDIAPHRLIEETLDGTFDYSEANSVGSRGVFIYYILQEGYIYHVSQPLNFKRHTTYFCRVENGETVKMDFNDVIKALVKRKPRRRLVDADTGEIVDA